MNSIVQALSSGYSVKKILEFLSKSDPSLALKINAGLAAGHTAEKILGFIQNAGSKVSSILSSDGDQSNNLYRQSQSIHPDIKTGFKALTAATTLAAGAAMAPRISQGISSLTSSMPNIPNTPPNTPVTPNPTPSPMQATPGQVIGAQNNTPTSPGQVAQAAQAIPNQQNVPQMPEIDSESIIDEMGLRDSIETLKMSGNSPEQIATAIEAFKMNPEQKKWLKSKTNVPFSEIVKDYVQKFPDIQQSPLIKNRVEQPNEFIETELDEIEPVKIEKGSEVLTPNGMGEVKGEDSKGFIVESEGKTTRIPHEEAISSPLPEKDMADLYTDLVNKIPESERSSMINVAAYDPNVNEFIFMPHDGALYVYKDIPQEFAEKLQAALFQAKTTGSNFYGAWSKGEESRGAGLSALIKDLQKLYGGKGKEYIRKYEKVYDFFALPKQALKEREKTT